MLYAIEKSREKVTGNFGGKRDQVYLPSGGCRVEGGKKKKVGRISHAVAKLERRGDKGTEYMSTLSLAPDGIDRGLSSTSEGDCRQSMWCEWGG